MFVFTIILVRIFFRIFFHSDWIRRDILRISSYSVRMRENAGKMQTMDTFYAVNFKVSQSIFEKWFKVMAWLKLSAHQVYPSLPLQKEFLVLSIAVYLDFCNCEIYLLNTNMNGKKLDCLWYTWKDFHKTRKSPCISWQRI